MGDADNRIDITPNMVLDEAVTDVAATPGMLVKKLATGNMDLRAAANAHEPIAVAVQKTQGGAKDAYVAGETMRVGYPSRAQPFNVLLAPSQTVAIGAQLEAVNGGLVQIKATGITLFVADEAVTTGAGENKLCRVRGAGDQIT